MATRAKAPDPDEEETLEAEEPETPKAKDPDAEAEARVKKWMHEVLDERETTRNRPARKPPPKRTAGAASRSPFNFLFGG